MKLATKEDLIVGKKLKIYFYDEEYKDNNTNIEIRAIVDDRIVFRYWRKHKKSYFYIIESFYYFELLIKDKCLFIR